MAEACDMQMNTNKSVFVFCNLFYSGCFDESWQKAVYFSQINAGHSRALECIF